MKKEYLIIDVDLTETDIDSIMNTAIMLMGCKNDETGILV